MRDELLHVERLGDVIVGADVETPQLVGLLAFRRDDDDRNAAVGAQQPA